MKRGEGVFVTMREQNGVRSETVVFDGSADVLRRHTVITRKAGMVYRRAFRASAAAHFGGCVPLPTSAATWRQGLSILTRKARRTRRAFRCPAGGRAAHYGGSVHVSPTSPATSCQGRE